MSSGLDFLVIGAGAGPVEAGSVPANGDETDAPPSSAASPRATEPNSPHPTHPGQRTTDPARADRPAPTPGPGLSECHRHDRHPTAAALSGSLLGSPSPSHLRYSAALMRLWSHRLTFISSLSVGCFILYLLKSSYSRRALTTTNDRKEL